MRTRRDKEKLNERDLGLGTRGNFGSSGGIVFPDDGEDEFDWEKFPFSTTTTTTPSPQPLPLDSVMESLMEDVNTTELLVRFGHLDTSFSVNMEFHHVNDKRRIKGITIRELPVLSSIHPD